MAYANLKNPACYLYGPGEAKIEESPVPEITDPNDVIVRIAFVGVCGSDVHFWTHGGIRRMVQPGSPLILGHEASGIVHSVGSAVTSLNPGDHISLEPGIPCRTCKLCKSGRYNLCPQMRFAACPPDTHGTLVRYYKTADDFCYKLPATLSLEEGVLAEPLAVAVHTCRLASIQLGQRVVVFGSGTVGLLCAAVARAMGAAKIISVDTNPKRLAFAKTFAADATYAPSPGDAPEDTAASIISQNDLGLGADVVLEATGVEPCIEAGVHVLGPGRVFVQAGLGKPRVQFPIFLASEKELCIRGCFRYATGDFELAVELLQEGKVRVSELITNTVQFEQATEAWEMTRAGVGIKNIIAGPKN